MISFPTRRIGHVNLFVSNLERTMDFYMFVCGFEQTARETHNGAGFLSNGNTNHDIGVVVANAPVLAIPALSDDRKRSEHAGLNHFGWELANEAELVGAYKRALAIGKKLPHIDMGTGRSVFIDDDDGVQHQFYVSNTRNWRTVYTGQEVELHANPPWDPLAGEAKQVDTYDLSTDIRRVEMAPLHPMRITHAVMVAPDLPRALKFYTDTAGLTVSGSFANGQGAYLSGRAQGHSMVLLAANDDLKAGFHHAAFEVWPQDDLNDAAKALEKRGVKVSLTLDLPYKRSIFLNDPDGIQLEFYQRRGMPAPREGLRGKPLAYAC
jgi:catechol 2,3-dioxygenase